MNIFRILAQGDGAIQEPNISAFLGYLLNPNEDHGLGSNFLESFLEQHYLRCKNDSTIENKKLDWIYDEGEIIDLSTNSNYEVNVFFEQAFKGEKKKDIVDIMLVIHRVEKEKKEQYFKNYILNERELKHIFLIEVKIKDSACTLKDETPQKVITSQKDEKINTTKKEGQLVDQITKSKKIIEDLFELGDSKKSKDMDISIIFITPDYTEMISEVKSRKKNTKAYTAFSELNDFLKLKIETSNTLRSHIFWNNIRDENDEIIPDKNYLPIEQLLDNIIYSKHEDKSEPIPHYTIDTIKSFSNFIYSDFSYKYKKPISGKGIAMPHEKFDEFKLKYQNDLSKRSWNQINELCDRILELDNKLKVDHSLTHPLSYFYDYNNKKVNGTKIFSITSIGKTNRSLCLHFIFKRNYQIDLMNDFENYFDKTKCKFKESEFGVIVSNIDEIQNESIIQIIKIQLDKIKKLNITNE